MVGKPN